MHYSSSQKIMLVGEGNFSFAASLATAFGSANNIVATSLDSKGITCDNLFRFCYTAPRIHIIDIIDLLKLRTFCFQSDSTIKNRFRVVSTRDGQWLWRAGNRGYLSITVYSRTSITVYSLGNCLNGYTHTHNRLVPVYPFILF